MYLGLTSLPIIQNTKELLFLPVIHSPFYGTKICTAFWLSRIWGSALCMQNKNINYYFILSTSTITYSVPCWW